MKQDLWKFPYIWIKSSELHNFLLLNFCHLCSWLTQQKYMDLAMPTKLTYVTSYIPNDIILCIEVP